MTDAATKARNAYRREWAKKNPDKVRAQQQRYWAKKAAAAEAAQQPDEAKTPKQ